MAKKFKKLLKLFTLIELIIVIAIIAVLGVSAFIVLSQWMSKGRDSQRISDLSTIKTALDIAITKNDELPLPDEANVLLYSGTEILYQGKFGDNVVKSIGTLNKLPKDRVHGEYEYSLSYDKKTYKIKAKIENEQYIGMFMNQVKANEEYYRYIGKDIGGVLIEDKFVYVPNMFISGYVNNKYDLLSGTNVFLGEKVGDIKEGGIADNNEESVMNMFTALGIEVDQGVKLYEKVSGSSVQVYKPKDCEPVIMSGFSFDSINNGVSQTKTVSQAIGNGTIIKTLTATCNDGNVSYGEIGESIECVEGYVESNKTCVANLCQGTPPAHSIINGTQAAGISWTYNQIGGQCTYQCELGYHYSNGECIIDDGWYGDATNGYYFYNGGEIKYPSSCNNILVSTGVNYITGNKLPVSGTGFVSGFYLIKPDISDPYKVYCEMLLDGGGWMRLDAFSAKGGTIIQGVGTINNSFVGNGNLVAYNGTVGGNCGVANSIRNWSIPDSLYSKYKPEHSYVSLYIKTASKTGIDCGPRGGLNKSTASDGFYRPIDNNLTNKCSTGGGFGTAYYNGINGYAVFNVHESGILQTNSTYNSSHDISKSVIRVCITCGSGNVTINISNIFIK